MYNFRLTLKEELVVNLDNFNNLVVELAKKSVEFSAERKELQNKIDTLIEAKADAEKIAEVKADLDTKTDAFNEYKKGINTKLYGGKNAKGDKVGGYCDGISKNIYEGYCAKVTARDGGEAFRKAIREFLVANVTEEVKVKDRTVAEFAKQLDVLIGARWNSNKNIADNCAKLAPMNYRNFKKMVFGALSDIISKNVTIKVAKKADK